MLDAAYYDLLRTAHQRSLFYQQAMPLLSTLKDRQDGPASAPHSQLRHRHHAEATLVVNDSISHALYSLLRTKMRLEGHAESDHFQKPLLALAGAS